MDVRLSGAVELVSDDGQIVEIGPPQRCCVLAALAIDAGRQVSVETLIDRVWGDEPPERARRSLHAHVARIRRVLADPATGGDARLTRRSGGYVLDVDLDRVDLHLFRRLVVQARAPGCNAADRLELLRRAVDRWRGEPLAGVPGEWAVRIRVGWRQQYLDAVVAWTAAELRSGSPDRVIGPLEELLDAYPLVEPLSTALMQALHAARRPADALAVYAATRRRLVDELGAEPGAELQDVHRAVLRGDGSRTASDNAAGRRAQTAVAPAQLPMEVRGFTGRVDELRRLDAIAAAQNDNPTAVIISALSGTAGVGKTALAVHWAHGVAEHFPDGQLYANLRGFDPTAPAVTPAETLHGFLNALGIPRQSVPSHVEAQAALYRSLLSGRRMLILLDNVRDADQIRILLPGSPGVLVVVTSRNQLSSLVAAEGAYPVTLDLLTQDDARALLAGRLGAERLAAEPAAADELIAACARLPLALTIVAARAIQHPGFRLAELAEGLRASQGRLDAFGGGDSATDVRSVFSWSYDTLGADAARLFRLLGLHLGSDISLPAAASLIGAPIGPVRSLLAELSLAHLITEHSPGRYACHDLLRAYAAELTEALDTADDRQAARQRLFDHYLHTAHAAGRILDPYRWMDLAPGVPDSRVLPETVTDYAGAVAWLEAERPILLAVADHAARTGVQPHAWQLAESIAIFLERRGDWHEMLAMQQTALDAARRQPDPLVEASARRHLGRGLGVLNRYAEADEQYRQALDLADRAGHVAGQAHVHMNLANVASRRGDAPAALRHSRRALELFRSCDNDRGQGSALNNVGWCHAKLGEYQLCIEHCDQALVLEEKIGDAIGEAHTVDTLGYAYHHLGAYDRAIDYYRRALAAHREFRDRYHEATVLTHIADSHHAAGRPDLAAEAWHQALEILTDLHHPDAEQVRAKLVRR